MFAPLPAPPWRMTMRAAEETSSILAVIGTHRYDPPMVRIARCPDCGYEWRCAEGEPIVTSSMLDLEVRTFDNPPHRFLIWRCSCGAELGVWTDRDGILISTDLEIRGKES